MKVILLRDVAKLGKRNTVAEVPNGYAQNKLIPSGMALPATPANLKRLEKTVSAQVAQTENEQALFVKALAELKDKPVIIQVEANAQGGLFQAIKPTDIAKALAQAGIHGVPIEAIKIDEPIKSSGEHQVSLVLGDQSGVCKLHIEVSS